MNRHIIKVNALFIVSAGLLYAASAFVDPKNPTQQDLVALNKKVFGADRLYQQPLDSTSLSDWKEVINNLQNFVARYSLNDTKLMKLYRDIKRANNDLMRTTASTYTSISKNAMKNSDSMTRAKNVFAGIEARMMAAQEALKALDYEAKETGFMKVRDTLLILATCVELSATKAGKDIDKEIDLRQAGYSTPANKPKK